MQPPRRWLLTILLATIITLGALGALFYRSQERTLVSSAYDELLAMGRFKAGQIETWRSERLADARFFSKSSFFAETAPRVLRGGDSQAERALLERFRALQESYGYLDVLLVDRDARIRFSVSGRSGGLSDELAPLMDGSTVSERPALSELHAGPGDLPPHLDVIVPIPDLLHPEDGPVATVILQEPGDLFLYPLIATWPDSESSIETVLFQKDGDHVLFLNPLKYRDDPPMTIRIPLTETDVPAVQAVLGRRGIMRGNDYRGVPVVSDLRSIPGSDWFIVSKVDDREVYAAWYTRARFIIATILFLLIAVTASVGLVWRSADREHLRELYKLEQKRNRSERRFSTTIHSIGDGVLVTDTATRVEYMNPVAESLTGWPLPDAKGRPIEEVFRILNEDSREMVESPVNKVVREGTVVGLANHTLLIARDGTERPVADSGAPINDEDGSLSGVVLVFRDQSKEREAHRALEESHRRFQMFYEQSPVAYQSLDGEGNILEVNHAWCKMVGYAREAAVGRCFSDLMTEESSALFSERFSVFKEAGEVHGNEFDMVRGDGKVITVSVNGKAAVDEHGDFQLSHCVLTDISETRRVEAERRMMEEQLAQTQKLESIGLLAGGVAHDFNNMLGVILGRAEMAISGVHEEKIRNQLEEIIKAAQHSTDLSRQLLAFARRQTVNPRMLDVNDTISGMLKMLQRLIGEDISLQWKPSKESATVLIDPSQVDQILANLMVNARDAISGTGHISIETGIVTIDDSYNRLHAEAIPGDYVRLTVSDDGCGMDQKTMASVFDPFFTTKELGEGTGLGLSTVYGIVHQNNGFINVYSEPGNGATFRIYIPYLRDQEAAEIRGSSDAEPVGGSETILIVEDEEAILGLGSDLLVDLGYNVLAARTPREALNLVKGLKEPLDLLLTDVVMPEMNGKELAERLRATYPDLPCLYMSGYTADVIGTRGVLDEGIHFLEKPFTRPQLAARVRDVLDEYADAT